MYILVCKGVFELESQILDLLKQMQKETFELNTELSAVKEKNKEIYELLVSINERLQQK